MFYAHFVLAKKGPLARIWLAAHWDKKLTKAHVFEINIEHSVEGILQPKVKMALRTSGHLLLGIVRIYSRKAKYLLADCNEAFIKIKMAFRPGVVDLPEGNREAAVATITLPEVFHDFDSAMPDITIDMDSQVTLNQCRAEDITIKEDYGNLSLINDGFDDFDEVEVVRDAANIDDGFNRDGFNFDNPPNPPEDSLQDTNSICMNQDVSIASIKDNIVPTVADSLLDNDAGPMFEAGGLFDEPIAQVPSLGNNVQDPVEDQLPVKPALSPDSDDDDIYDVGPPSMGPPSPPSSPESPTPQIEGGKQPEADVAFPDELNNALAADLNDMGAATSSGSKGLSAIPEMPPPPALATFNQPQLGEVADSFALAPLDATIVQGTERTVKAKRKRKLIVDEVKNISGEEMKSQLSDTSDIVTSLDLAPPTKRLMHWKETGGVEKLFALPGHPILSKTLSRLYQRHLTTRSIDNEEVPPISPEDDYEPARKKVCEIEPGLPPDLTNVNPTTFERPSFQNDSDIMHPGMDLSSNIPTPQHPVFHLSDQSQPQLVNSMMPNPTHMMHQMLSPQMSPLPLGSQMMPPPSVGVDPMSQLPPSVGPNMHEMPPSGLVEFTQSVHPSVIESVPQHLISNFMPSAIENQGQPENQLSQSPVMDQVHNQPLNLPLDPTSKEVENCLTGQDLDMNSSANHDLSQPFPPDDQLCFDKIMASNHVDQNLLHAENDELIVNEQGQLPETPFAANNTDDALLESNKQPDGVDNLLIAHRQADQSDDDDDYGAPSSVGPVYPEEQMADETYEQFEERILTKRTTHMLHIIHHQLDNDREVRLSELSRNNKRKQVAQKFYTLLVLKKQQAVELQQDGPYGDLIITTGPKFNAVYNAN